MRERSGLGGKYFGKAREQEDALLRKIDRDKKAEEGGVNGEGSILKYENEDAGGNTVREQKVSPQPTEYTDSIADEYAGDEDSQPTHIGHKRERNIQEGPWEEERDRMFNRRSKVRDFWRTRRMQERRREEENK